LEYPHEPVLVQEAVEDLITRPDGVYVDGTCGSGGHSELIGKRLSDAGRLICLDRDPDAVIRCRERILFLKGRGVVRKANFADMDRVFEDMGVSEVTGVMLDLGVSTYQLDQSERGFSFRRDEPLDMRMDPESGVTAAHLVNTLPAKELARIFREFGEERKARALGMAIERARSGSPFTSSLQVAEVIRSVVHRSRRPGAKDPATRAFQALRIAVNRELDHLRVFLDKAPNVIERGGRLVILSYHSLEDRMVKQAFRVWEKGCTCPPDFPVCTCGGVPLFRLLRRGGLKPSQEEIARNPRARSATLRTAERM